MRSLSLDRRLIPKPIRGFWWKLLGFKARILAHFNFQSSLSYAGCKVVRPNIGGVFVSPTEPELLRFLRGALPRLDGAFVDVGANMGQTLLKVKATDPRFPYLGIEPDPTASLYLTRLSLANNWPCTSLVSAAVGDGLSLGRLARCDGDAGNRLVDEGGSLPDQQVLLTVVLAGDSILAMSSVEKVALLKIDVEGREVAAIQGFAGSIRRDLPVIVVEILPPRPNLSDEENRRRTERFRAIALVAQDMGYSSYHLNENGVLVGPLDLRMGVPPRVKTGTESLNYVLLHQVSGSGRSLLGAGVEVIQEEASLP